MDFVKPLIPGRLERRYKRFLADVTLEDGQRVTSHLANTGSMAGLKEPGTKVWLEPSDDPKRKLKFSWRLVELTPDNLVGVDTSFPNRLVGEALQKKRIAELADYSGIRSEVKYGEKSRVDFLLSEPDKPDLYLEIKNVHFSRTVGLAEFPDSVTSRGARHMTELASMVQQGHRAVVLFVVQRTDCQRFSIANDMDAAYADAFEAAKAAGVEPLAYDSAISPTSITLANRLALV